MPEQVLHDEALNDQQLGRVATFSIDVASPKPILPADPAGQLVRGLQVFRAGSFKDSAGQQREWTVDQLFEMAENFGALRLSNTFPNVPVRADHSQSVQSIVGYIEALHVSGDRLVADIEFTEPEHYAKYARGTYRSRSIEIGSYEDNAGNTHFPVVLGLAFVDLPAVEGLFRSPAASHFRYQDGTKEPPVAEKSEPQLHTFRIGGQETTDYAKVQEHVAQLEGDNASLLSRNEALETFAKEQVKQSRHNFVSSLAEAKRIAATQIDALKGLVEGMSDEQFEAFQKAYEGAPTLGLLGDHGAGNPTNPEGQPDPAKDERAVLEETLAMHRRSGMTDEEVQRTGTYRKLAALNGQK